MDPLGGEVGKQERMEPEQHWHTEVDAIPPCRGDKVVRGGNTQCRGVGEHSTRLRRGYACQCFHTAMPRHLCPCSAVLTWRLRIDLHNRSTLVEFILV